MGNVRFPILLAVVAAWLACMALLGPAAPVAAGAAIQPPGQAPRLHGTILDWGQGNMPAGVAVTLKGEGWELATTTDAAGEYAFQQVGNEIALLNAEIPAGRDDLFLLATDLPVRMRADGELIVNVAFYPKGITPEPLLQLKVDASPAAVEAGGTVSYTLTAINTWDRGMNQVIVADLLPQGLRYAGAVSSQGSVLYEQGLVWAELGSLAAGDEATVTITVQVGTDVEPGTTITNQAAAYHSENAAVQNEVPVAVVAPSNGVLPETGVAWTVPPAAIFVGGMLWAAFRMRRRPD